MRFIGFYNYTVVLTYMSLISGVIGMRLAYGGRLGAAIICLAVSGICDLFDGAVARTKKNRTSDEKNFGIQLDSLCDVVCFGVFPAIFCYFSGVNSVLGVAILALYVLCAVIRLAFFNVLEINRQAGGATGSVKCFRGMPVTTAAIAFPLFYIVGLLVPAHIMTIVYYVLSGVMAILFISDISVPKFDVSKLFGKRSSKETQPEERELCRHEEV